jgi:hypothetical protein
MIDSEKIIEDFCAESKDANSVWVLYSEGGHLALEKIDAATTPLWSSLPRCLDYISNISSENEMRPVEIPMGTFLVAWTKTASSNNSVFCLNASKGSAGLVIVTPDEIKELLGR